MPPPRTKPGDSTEPRLSAEERDDEEISLAKTKERPEFREEDTAPTDQVKRDPLINSTVGGYKIEGVLGRGSSGIVYRAQHQNGRKAAFKVLKPELASEPEYIRRLIEEAKALIKIRHPGIIDILDFGSLYNGQPYLAMELCDGLSLEEQLKFGGQPTVNETVGLLEDLLDALDAAHSGGIVHRDLKPSNLFLATSPDGDRVLKVLDFGLARVSDGRRSVRPTMAGAIIGTPDYMAPEQINGKKVGPWTDIYAVGGIAFRLLTNRLPFVGPTGIAVISRKMDEPPPTPREVTPGVPEALDELVHQMLARDPGERPTVEEARTRLAAYRAARRGAVHSLMDEEPSARRTAFHQFNDVGAAQAAIATTIQDKRPLGFGSASPFGVPAASPPMRPTDRTLIPPNATPPGFRTQLDLQLPTPEKKGGHGLLIGLGGMLFGIGVAALAYVLSR